MGYIKYHLMRGSMMELNQNKRSISIFNCLDYYDPFLILSLIFGFNPNTNWLLQLINHGVSNSLMENVKSGIQEFFNLPIEEKKMFRQHSGDVEEFGQIFVVSEEQKLDWADLFYLTTLPAHLRKPHLFPKLPLPFRFSLSLSLSLKHT
jgi:hypothetical protein